MYSSKYCNGFQMHTLCQHHTLSCALALGAPGCHISLAVLQLCLCISSAMTYSIGLKASLYSNLMLPASGHLKPESSVHLRKAKMLRALLLSRSCLCDQQYLEVPNFPINLVLPALPST